MQNYLYFLPLTQKIHFYYPEQFAFYLHLQITLTIYSCLIHHSFFMHGVLLTKTGF